MRDQPLIPHYVRPLKRAQLWLEETRMEGRGATDVTLRIFYPNGSSEFLSMNVYYDNGDVLLKRSNLEWQQSQGNDWHPKDLYARRAEETKANFLGYL